MFLKNLSYEAVLEKFIPRLIKVMSPILEINKYVDVSLARCRILALPEPNQVLPQIGAKIPFAQLLAIQQNTEEIIGILIPKQNLIVSYDSITSSGINQNLDSQHEVGSNSGIATSEPLAFVAVIPIILKTLEELKKENEVVRPRLDL